MQKNKINFIVDFLSFIVFIVLSVTGLIIFFFLPDGVRQGGLREFMGITKKTYADIHDYAGIVFFILVCAHVILHWQWVKCTIKSFFIKEN